MTWIREKTAPGTYDITFTYVNQFSDTAERTVPVSVNGETEDLTITLLTDEAVIPLGTEFDPEDYLEISDPTGSASSVQVTGEVDTEREGRYSVYYTVISSDRTQKAGGARIEEAVMTRSRCLPALIEIQAGARADIG